MLAELGADSFEISPTAQRFKSGRPKFVAVFSRDSGEETRRDAMQLTSKRTGRPYFVASRTEQAEPRADKHARTLAEFLGVS